MTIVKKHPKYLIASALVSIVLLVLCGHEAVVLFLSLVMTSVLLESYLSVVVFNSRIYRFIVSTVAYFTILQTVILSMWVFNHNIPLNYSLDITAVVLILSLLTSYFTKNKAVPKTELNVVKNLTYIDLVSIGVSLLILIAVLAVPVVHSVRRQGHLDVGSTVENYVNTGLDDSSHLSRINDRLQLNRGVLYDSNVTPYVVFQNTISTYPPSWHSANAVLIKSLDPNIKVGGQSLIAYVLTKIFWLFVLVYCFARVTFTVFSVFVKRTSRKRLFSDHLWLTGSIFFFSYYALLEQFKEGFYNFIPLLISNVLCLALLIQLGIDKGNKERPSIRYRALLPLTIMLTSATLSWFLVVPAVLVAMAFAVYDPLVFSLRNTRKIVFDIWVQLRTQSHLFLLCAASILVQTIVITAGSSRSFSEGVNDPGAISLHSSLYFAFIVIGVLLFYGIMPRKLRSAREIAPYLISLLGMALFIYVFQILTIGKPEYYYFKTLNTVIIVALPLAIVGWLMLTKLAFSGLDQLTTLALSAGLLICLPLVIGINPLNTSNVGYVLGKREFSASEDAFIYNNLSNRAKVPLSQRTEDVIFFTPDIIGHNIVGTNILRSIQPVDSCDAKIFAALEVNNEPALLKSLSTCESAHMTIVTRPAFYKTLRSDIAAHHISNKVTVLAIQ